MSPMYILPGAPTYFFVIYDRYYINIFAQPSNMRRKLSWDDVIIRQKEKRTCNSSDTYKKENVALYPSPYFDMCIVIVLVLPICEIIKHRSRHSDNLMEASNAQGVKVLDLVKENDLWHKWKENVMIHEGVGKLSQGKEWSTIGHLKSSLLLSPNFEFTAESTKNQHSSPFIQVLFFEFLIESTFLGPFSN